jgi:hypothetical protein
VADVEHGKRLINTDDPAALEALRHRPSHSTGTRRHVENLFIALQNEHFSQFLGEISADPRGSAIKLSRVLRVVEMSLVSVAMPVPMFVTVLVVVSMFVIVRVLMPVFVIMVSVVMFVAVLGGVSVFMIVLMVVFVFFAHGFVIPSNEIRLILACLHHR